MWHINKVKALYAKQEKLRNDNSVIYTLLCDYMQLQDILAKASTGDAESIAIRDQANKLAIELKENSDKILVVLIEAKLRKIKKRQAYEAQLSTNPTTVGTLDNK